MTTDDDPEGRRTVFDLLPDDLPRLISVGRLDYNTEGLLLFTNDGELARHLELPASGYARSYRVRVFGKVEEARLASLKRGITIDGERFGPIDAALERSTGANHWLVITIHEGRNREVRRICETLGLVVNRLIRVGFGPFALDDLKPGALVEMDRNAWTEVLPHPFGHGKAPKPVHRERPAGAGKPPPRRGPPGAGNRGGPRANHRGGPRADHRR